MTPGKPLCVAVLLQAGTYWWLLRSLENTIPSKSPSRLLPLIWYALKHGLSYGDDADNGIGDHIIFPFLWELLP